MTLIWIVTLAGIVALLVFPRLLLGRLGSGRQTPLALETGLTPSELRHVLLRYPHDRDARRRYLATRTAALEFRDWWRGVVGALLPPALIGGVVMMGIAAGFGAQSGTMVFSVGSMTLVEDTHSTRIHGDGATLVSRGGGLTGAMIGALGGFQMGAILGVLIGIVVRSQSLSRFAQLGPLPWPVYWRSPRSWNDATPPADIPTGGIPTSIYLLNARNQAFLNGTSAHLAGGSTFALLTLAFFACFIFPAAFFGVLGNQPPLPELIATSTLPREGLLVDATRVSVKRDVEWAQGTPVIVLDLSYQYAVGEASYERTERVPGFGLNIPEGERIPVVVRKEDPSQSRTVAECDSARSTLTVLGITGVLWLGSVGALIPMTRSWWAGQKLKRQGRLLWGSVVNCQTTTTEEYDSENNQSRTVLRCTIDYAFDSPGGRTVPGQHRVQGDPTLAATLPAVGSPVAVLYVDDSLYEVL